MANLVIDIGNTAFKAAWTEEMTIGKTFRYQGERMMEFILSLISKQIPEVIVISSVRGFSQKNRETLEKHCSKLIFIDDKVADHYGFPSYLTSDRIASLVASRYLFTGKSCTVFDLGALLTVDNLDSEGNYIGGSISLGCRTRFKSLNRYSRNLPLLECPEEFSEDDTDLNSSIYSGIIGGMVFELNGYFSEKPENIKVFTGGDAIYFAKRMKNSIFVVCNLVLMGLALIALKYD